MSVVIDLRRLLGDLNGVWRYAGSGTRLRYFGAVLVSLPRLVRERSLVPADRRMAGRRCTFHPIAGTRIVVEGASFSGARELYCRRVYFAEPGFEPQAGETVVDLGANEGLFSLLAAVRGATVYAVEAQSGFHPLLRANVDRNGCGHRVRAELALVGGGTGLLSAANRAQVASHWGAEPEVLTLAEVIGRQDRLPVGLMKVDIEGSEFDLFGGSLACLSDVGRIVMEVHPAFGSVRDLQDAVANAGFSTTLRDSEGRAVGRPEQLTARGGYLFATRKG